ncbi:MAG: GNAT family N-acetyltransferase [Patescibacteria group bacterium]
MNIRLAQQEDKEPILSLLDELILQANIKSGSPPASAEKAEAKSKLYDELIAREDVKIFVAEHENAIVGVADLFIVPIMRRGYYQGHIEDFVVTEKMRGKGVGSMILRKIKEYCKKNNIRVIKLTTAIEFKEAQAFYEKNGGKFTEKMYRFDLQ